MEWAAIFVRQNTAPAASGTYFNCRTRDEEVFLPPLSQAQACRQKRNADPPLQGFPRTVLFLKEKRLPIGQSFDFTCFGIA
jgi:hypothetical protein